MTEKFIDALRKIENFERAELISIQADKSRRMATLTVITDCAYSDHNQLSALALARKYVPEYLNVELDIKKITPDCDMVKRKIYALAKEANPIVASLLKESDVTVNKTENGFNFSVAVTGVKPTREMADGLINKLDKTFCGVFTGEYVEANINLDDIEIEEEEENIEYLVPVRSFEICNFKAIESTERPKTAVYIADMNFESESVSVCGTIDNIEQRTYTKKDGTEKAYFQISLNDTTGSMRITAFTRQRSADKISALKEGDSIVCTLKSENYNGNLRFTSNAIDYGTPPEGFIPERRTGKPAPKFYSLIKPQPYVDFSQTDMFSKSQIPDCIRDNVFVVLDLETTGTVTNNSTGAMDRIIEIGACRIENGVISETFSTLVNPQRKLPDKIIELTGITDEMLAPAPTYEQVMPDFYKFCNGAYLVGHNIAGFDFKFIDHYWQQLGYFIERKIFDTLPIAQNLLFLKNYKLDTIADRFGFTFNHHRASDDAITTAKIFIELIKLKKSLPKPC